MIADLTGKTAFVTGGGQGVGRAIAIALAQQGADVAVGDVRADLAAQVAAEIEQQDRQALALSLDVRSRQSARDAVAAILARWSKLDILVNNAGVVSAPPGPNGDTDPDTDWDYVFGVNLRGLVNCCDAAMAPMTAQRSGKIVNISSTAGRPGDPPPPLSDSGARRDRPPLGGSAYALSKAAVIRHTQMLASSAARFNINVNCVCPSRMITPMGLAIAARSRPGAVRPSDEEVVELRRDAVIQVNRFGRELEPVDVAKMVAFLASEDARNITGQSINVDGGFKMI
ncbi:MAG TPA: SDR family NAD(P)-dependent oxidoreductase [Chloroflexota bacterium]|nr:SDR family NAD(P)-dependent oxidoreductase [Chloroflexota bacterium]